MSYLVLSQMAVVLSSIAISVGLYAQVFKILRTKSADDFTTSLIVAVVTNEFTWLNYGLYTFNWPIIFIGVLNTPAAVMLTYGYFRYRTHKKEKCNE